MAPGLYARFLNRMNLTLVLRPLSVAALSAVLVGCGLGCLYQERGKVAVIAAEVHVAPERLVAVIGNALQPMGFSGHTAKVLTPRPEWYWDYEFRSPGVGKFAPRDVVEVLIKFDDLSITVDDFDRASVATEFDRRVTAAIQAGIRSELGADIVFKHPKPPALCLGP